MGFTDLNRQSRIKNDDILAFEKLFKAHYAELCRFSYSMIHDADQAEEIVQEFFYNYWKNRKSISIQISLKAYMYKSVRNASLRYLQHKKVEDNYKKNAAFVMKSSYQNGTIEESEMMEMVEKTLEQLPDRCKQVFLLSRVNGLKYKEIANMLSVSIKTVEADMGKALMTFRQNLSRTGYNIS
ncbi:MAG TPA: RNA polymerase sigma-70 factor [Tenuifilaceae bacterium]|nr:RNA polymerase sigma-70 factor [Tenuifilaceae bacterium]